MEKVEVPEDCGVALTQHDIGSIDGKPRRKSNRLPGYDYSANGAYFVTICVKDRHEIFGTIVGARLASPVSQNRDHVKLTRYGVIAEQELKNISAHYPCVNIDCYVIMPNHIHAIILILGDLGEASLAPTLGEIVGGYKSGVSRLCGFSLWQRSFHDHIIRSHQDYNRIAKYIELNPVNWEQDCYFASN